MFTPASTPTSDVASTQSLNSPQPTRTSELSLTPEATFTPGIPPTPVPLPIRENFSKQYSDLWRVSGEPFLSAGDTMNYDGVLTVKFDETGSIWIENSGWTDYIVLTSISSRAGDPVFTLGVRVKDLNNMVAFKCDFSCSWIVVKDGITDELLTSQSMDTEGEFKISAEGDSFIATGTFGRGNQTYTSALTLPPKYQGIFPSGGVLLEIVNGTEVDHIEIQPLK